MKYALVLTLALILTACSSSSSHQVENTDSAVPQSKWFDIGYNEALVVTALKKTPRWLNGMVRLRSIAVLIYRDMPKDSKTFACLTTLRLSPIQEKIFRPVATA
ncbi:Uncharacterised protein [Budvicia aquatica]|uniref:Lipoprotein n=1 Tax=Budvicia aquatica TaxID=82979 RepID=A0A484ZY84_9GAMM|nr:hypothetical protein [Budvicia aquatica]VFS52951.1 Uncharacterised protein [Budvicia aquatica]